MADKKSSQTPKLNGKYFNDALSSYYKEIDAFTKSNPEAASIVDDVKANASRFIESMQSRIADNKHSADYVHSKVQGYLTELPKNLQQEMEDRSKLKPVPKTAAEAAEYIEQARKERTEQPSKPKKSNTKKETSKPKPKTAVEEAFEKAQAEAKRKAEEATKKTAKPIEPQTAVDQKTTASKIGNNEIVNRVMNTGRKYTSGRFKIAGGIGAAAGLAKTMWDDTDDSLGSTVAKMGVGAGLAAGSDFALHQLMTKTKWGQEWLEDVTSGTVVKNDITSQVHQAADPTKPAPTPSGEPSKASGPDISTADINKEEVKVAHDNSMDKQKRVKKIKSWHEKGKLAGMIGLGVFAVASVMDTSQSMADHTESSRMKEEQERNLNRKQTREKRDQNQYAYGHVDMGEMVLDMFNNRTGHYKMGNAKFQ